MPHFLLDKNEIKSEYIELQNSETLFHLIKVRRVKIGEQIKFIDEDKTIYNCKITDITKKSLSAQILSKEKSNRFLKCNLSLIQSILASDAQNDLIANATQTGVKKIYPVISDNISAKVQNEKIEKWQKIVYENFKQCERADIAYVQNIMPLKEVLAKFKKRNILIFSEKDINISIDDSVKNLDLNSEIALVIGPEGGFSNKEFDYFKENNYKLITLGKMIYKAPCAVVAAVSNIISRIENE